MSDHSEETSSVQLPTTYEVLMKQGITRREFLGFCSVMAAMMGMSSVGMSKLVEAMETKPRIPVLWLHGLECTCCTESFIRSANPEIADVLMNMISLDFDDTLMAAAGHQAEEIIGQVMRDYKGKYLLAVEGNVPLANKGWNCFVGGRPFGKQLEEAVTGAKAVIAWGTCASFGCVQAAKPNPTQATPISKLVSTLPVINVPGCPPVAEVMTGIITYLLTHDELPELDHKKRPKLFYGSRVHADCPRKPHFDAGRFVMSWDDEGARQGYCLVNMGCRGPNTYNACTKVKWNGGTSSPVEAGHGCIGCAEEGSWDRGSFYQ